MMTVIPLNMVSYTFDLLWLLCYRYFLYKRLLSYSMNVRSTLILWYFAHVMGQRRGRGVQPSKQRLKCSLDCLGSLDFTKIQCEVFIL